MIIGKNMHKFNFVFLFLFISGCSNQYDNCLESQKADYRAKNPNASYGQVQSKQFEFELMCSKYKPK